MKETKRCSSCEVEKPSGEFHKDSSKPGGFSYSCRECVQARKLGTPVISASSQERARLLAEGRKTCTKCGETKSLGDFKMQKRKGGMFPTSWCRACGNAASNENMKTRYHSDPEFRARHTEYSRASHARPENVERKREYEKERRARPEVKVAAKERSAAWIAANPERHATNREVWRDANREKVRGYVRKYRAKNPELHADRNMVIQYARRWRVFNQGNTLTVLHMQLVQAFWDWKCAYCGEPTQAQNYRRGLDHVVAISMGGANAPGNVVSCCFSCNTKKNNRPLAEELMEKLSVQLEAFVADLPTEAEFKGGGRIPSVIQSACDVAATGLRGQGVPVGVTWTPTGGQPRPNQ